MKYSDVYDYTSNGKDRDEFRSYSDVSPYFTVNDKYVQLMCSELLKYKAQESMTDREFAEFVMIYRYASRENFAGKNEYPLTISVFSSVTLDINSSTSGRIMKRVTSRRTILMMI